MADTKLSVKSEIMESLSKPYRLPRSMAVAAVCTFIGIAIGLTIHTFHRGLPYIAADLFIWTLATYNVSQLGVDSERTIRYIRQKKSLRKLFFIKNTSMFALALPIDIILIVIACIVLGDWSKFWEAIVLGVTVVIVGLGIGNLASVAWVYKPVPLLRIRKDRVRLFEYAIFIVASYIAVSLALVLATVPAWLLLKIIGIKSVESVIIGVVIILVWAVFIWLICARIADNLTERHNKYFINRLNGKPMKVKNRRLKKILKVQV